jgi:hypothetical protein
MAVKVCSTLAEAFCMMQRHSLPLHARLHCGCIRLQELLQTRTASPHAECYQSLRLGRQLPTRMAHSIQLYTIINNECLPHPRITHGQPQPTTVARPTVAFFSDSEWQSHHPVCKNLIHSNTCCASSAAAWLQQVVHVRYANTASSKHQQDRLSCASDHYHMINMHVVWTARPYHAGLPHCPRCASFLSTHTLPTPAC